MTMRRLLLSAAILALAGCDLAPDYHPPVITAPASYKEAGPWQAAQPADSQPKGNWWRSFGDVTLDDLEGALDHDNADLAASVARYDQARADAMAAGAALSPQVGLAASSQDNRQSDARPLRGGGQPNEYASNQLGVAASYELDLWGKLRNEAAVGRLGADASAALLAQAKLSLEAELAADYLTLRGLDSDARLLGDTVAAFQKARDLTQTLFHGSIASGLDVSRAETQLDLARAQMSDIASRRALMEHAIAVLVGQPASTFSITPAMQEASLPVLPAGLPSSLLQRRPDIAAAERVMAAANAEIGVVRAAFYPALTLGLLGGVQSTSATLLSLPYSFWSLGPGVTLPVLDGGLRESRQGRAEARFREASEAYRGTVLRAFQEVEDNLALTHWLDREATDVDAGVAQAQRTLTIAMKLYQEGAASYLEVVTAQTTYLRTQQQSIDLQTRRLKADVGLIRALGGGWTSDS